MDTPRTPDENPLLDAEFFWYNIQEGDSIVLEADYLDAQRLVVLHQGRAYEVLSKQEQGVSQFSFIVQSDVTGELISVHPFLVGDYLTTDGRTVM